VAVTKAAKGRQPEEPATWIENELREAKARLHKVEGELDQALKQVWTLEADVKKVVEMSAATGSVTAALQAFREEVRQLRDQLSRLQDRQTAATNRIEQIAAQRLAETGRERHDLGLVVKQVEALARAAEQQETRAKALEEVARHVEEDVAGQRLSAQGTERAIEELSTRSARTQEATQRLHQEVGKYAGKFEKFQKEDEGLADRLALALEQLRRALERLDKLELFATFPDEAREGLQRAAFEREQLGQRVLSVERIATEVAERTEEFVQGLARLDTRSQQHASELLSLTVQLQELSEQMKGALKRMYQTILRQRRRQAEGLAQEIKELTQSELHSGD
jgi:chromosome segregation ATPase